MGPAVLASLQAEYKASTHAARRFVRAFGKVRGGPLMHADGAEGKGVLPATHITSSRRSLVTADPIVQ